MPNIINNHTGIPFTRITIQDAINQIKSEYESAIGAGTQANTIRGSRLIKRIHNAVKTDFLKLGIHPSLINPGIHQLVQALAPSAQQSSSRIQLCDRELKLAGYLKTKKQDISIIPNNVTIKPSSLTIDTMMNRHLDIYGEEFTESVLSINVRSQLSSISKNFDTLYERTFAEALNLHQRLPNMVLGEVYMIPVKEYTDSSAAENMVFSPIDIGKYISAFQAINNRASQADENYKYERCCLLIVDFEKDVPKIYNTTEELIRDDFLPRGSTISMTGLEYQSFASDLLNIYQQRFPNNTFT